MSARTLSDSSHRWRPTGQSAVLPFSFPLAAGELEPCPQARSISTLELHAWRMLYICGGVLFFKMLSKKSLFVIWLFTVTLQSMPAPHFTAPPPPPVRAQFQRKAQAAGNRGKWSLTVTFEIQNPIPFPGKLRPQTVYLVFMKSALSFPELKRGSWEGRGKTERVKEGKREGGRGRGSLLREQLQAK